MSKTDFRLSSCLFGSVKLTMNADLDKYKYSGYIIWFDSRWEISFTDGNMGGNVIIFRADMRSSVHIDNKNKDILILSKEPTQGVDDIALTARAYYPISFTQLRKRFVLSLHYNGSSWLLFVYATKIYQFKVKDSEINDYTLCLGNISKDFAINKMKKNKKNKKQNKTKKSKTGLKTNVKFLSLDFNPIDTNDVLDIHKYLRKKT